jgi:hypothetical protein
MEDEGMFMDGAEDEEEEGSDDEEVAGKKLN